jgi:hypothetical protein
MPGISAGESVNRIKGRRCRRRSKRCSRCREMRVPHCGKLRVFHIGNEHRGSPDKMNRPAAANRRLGGLEVITVLPTTVDAALCKTVVTLPSAMTVLPCIVAAPWHL